MSKTIYVVSARRGDYSDRTEYAVCWFPTKKAAEECAVAMGQKSDEWRSRLNGRWFVEKWNEAQAEIGDGGWSPSDHTDYYASELERGKQP